MPLVSIITPTRNRPEFLGEAISTVLAQSFGDFEMLIVDDGSHPSVQPVVERFADSRLCYFYQEHAGRSAARNLGMQAARGKYIAFLDDDDRYHPEKLARDTEFLRGNLDIDMVGSGYRLLDKDNQELSIIQPWNFKSRLNSHNCLYGCPLITCTVLIRRAVLDRLDHWFDTRLDMAEDADFFLRLLLSGARFAWLKEVLSDYRLLHNRSPAILLDIHRARRSVLEKIFSQNRLPAEIVARREEILIHHTLKSAWRAYDCRMPAAGQRFLLRALIEDPSLFDAHIAWLENSLISAANNSLYSKEPTTFVDYVLAHLPAPLRHLAQARQRLLDELSDIPNLSQTQTQPDQAVSPGENG